jgi:hypothetical protein
MAIMLVLVNSNSNSESPHLAGQIISVFRDDHIFGTQEVPSAGRFYHITVTDKTKAEVDQYIERWKHKPVTVQIQNQGNNRRIETTSDMVSATCEGAFIPEAIDDLMVQLDATLVELLPASFKFDIKANISEREEIIDQINTAVRRMQHSRRRWYIIQSGMDFLAGNGGVVSGPASQVGGFMRDGLLD